MTRNGRAGAFAFVEQLAKDLEDERLELPAFPDAVLRIQHALQSPDTGVGDIAAILASDPALAARILKTANSAAFRRTDNEITDLRSAVARMGYNMVRTIAVAFALRQIHLIDTYSPEARAEIRNIWQDSLQTASICHVLAKHYTQLNPDQALLVGLLHALGRLYIVMRMEESGDMAADVRDIAASWQASIGKAILDSWGLADALLDAVEKQDDVQAELMGEVSLADVLIAAKALCESEDPEDLAAACPAVARIGAVRGKDACRVLEACREEIEALRSSLAE